MSPSSPSRRDPSDDRRRPPNTQSGTHGTRTEPTSALTGRTSGQTEPIAAIVAVMAMVAGIGLYAVYLGGALPGLTERTPEETAIERLWEDLEADDRGVFPAYEYESDQDAAMRDAIEQESLPDGRTVYVEIRGYDDGSETVFAAAHFDGDGDTLADRQLPSSHDDFGPPDGPGEPDDTGVVTWQVPVERAPADVGSGILHVEVW